MRVRCWRLSSTSKPSARSRPVRAVLVALAAAYPDAATALVFSTPWQLLVATVLSAQCTDARVNRITARLFPECPDAVAMAALSVEDLEARVFDCGLYHAKARHLAAASRVVVDKWGGDLPTRIRREELEALPGVGRKTASVVLANAYGVPALAVDTHVFRVAHRLGWSGAKDADHTADDLCRLIPQRHWVRAHHQLIGHGRQICHARRPACDRCVLARWCPRLGVDVERAAAPRAAAPSRSAAPAQEVPFPLDKS